MYIYLYLYTYIFMYISLYIYISLSLTIYIYIYIYESWMRVGWCPLCQAGHFVEMGSECSEGVRPNSFRFRAKREELEEMSSA